MLNQSESCIYNPNLVRFNNILNGVFCVHKCTVLAPVEDGRTATALAVPDSPIHDYKDYFRTI